MLLSLILAATAAAQKLERKDEPQSEGTRIVVGGSWWDSLPSLFQLRDYRTLPPESQRPWVGFRLVLRRSVRCFLQLREPASRAGCVSRDGAPEMAPAV